MVVAAVMSVGLGAVAGWEAAADCLAALAVGEAAADCLAALEVAIGLVVAMLG